MNEAPPATAPKRFKDAGGHWYTVVNGEVKPLYKEGGTFTLREARKLAREGQRVLPSVTTYFKCLHKGALEDWLMSQAALAALQHPRDKFLSDDAWLEAVLDSARNVSKGAMDLGTAIHKGLELGLEGGDYDADVAVYVRPAIEAIQKSGFKLIAQEVCVANPTVGYAGRCDLLGEMAVWDAKSRKTRPGQAARAYSTDLMQLLCYGVAHFGERFLDEGECCNLIISTTEPGRVEVVTHDMKSYRWAWEAFIGLTAVWRFENKFDPRKP